MVPREVSRGTRGDPVLVTVPIRQASRPSGCERIRRRALGCCRIDDGDEPTFAGNIKRIEPKYLQAAVTESPNRDCCSPQKHFARLETRIVVGDLGGTLLTAEDLLHHEDRVELAQDRW